MNIKHLSLAAFLGLALVSCGGGSDDNGPIGGNDGKVNNDGAKSFYGQPFPHADLPQSKDAMIAAIIDAVGSEDAKKAVANQNLKDETQAPKLEDMPIQTMIGTDKDGNPIAGDELKSLHGILAKLLADGDGKLNYKDQEALYVILQNHKYSGTLLNKKIDRAGQTSVICPLGQVSHRDYPNLCCTEDGPNYKNCYDPKEANKNEDKVEPTPPFIVKSIVGRIALAKEVEMWDKLAKDGKMNKKLEFVGKAYSTGRYNKIEQGDLQYTLDLDKMKGSGVIRGLPSVNMNGTVLTLDKPEIVLGETTSLRGAANGKHELFNSQGVIVSGTANLVNAVYDKFNLDAADRNPTYYVAFGGSVPNNVMGAILNSKGEGVIPFHGLRSTPLKPAK